MIRTALSLLRPKQWVKNVVVFAALIFSKEFFVPGQLLFALGAFCAFCLTASAVYIINDIFDAEADRAHPEKRHRPIASGAITRKNALILLAALLLIDGLLLSFMRGMLIFLVGTLLTTIGGLILGVPLAIGTAIFVTQMAPPRAAGFVSRGIEVLAGIPSIVIGWLGFTVLVPVLVKLTSSTGNGILAASIILAIMIMPTITAIASDALESVPVEYKQGSFGLGATRWQTIWHVMLPAARPGLIVAVILGMGRAIGETMAVALVIGPATAWPKSLWTPTHTLTTKILMEIQESTGTTRSALFTMALVLLLFSMMMIMLVRAFTKKKEYARGAA